MATEAEEQAPISAKPTATYETLENTGDPENEVFNPIADEESKSTTFGATMNFINAIVGAGIVAIPYALKECGPILGIFSLFLIGVLAGYTLLLLYKAGQWTKKSSYKEVVAATFGDAVVPVLVAMQFSFPFMAMMSYQIIISDNLSTIVKSIAWDSPVADRRLLLLLSTVFIVLPLSYFKFIQSLSKISLASVISVVFLVCTVIYKAATQTHQTSPPSYGLGNFVIQSWGIILFAYVCHHNSFLIMNSLKERTEKNYNMVVWTSISVACVLMSIFGICGYIIFTDNVIGNILQNFCPCDTLVNFARVAFIIGVVTTFPLECFVCRDIIQSTLFNGREPSEIRHAAITCGIVAATSLISLVTDKLGLLLEVAGIVAAIPYAFIFPPALYLKLDPNGSQAHVGKISAILMLTFGCIFFVLGMTGLIMKIVRNVSETPDLSYCVGFCNRTLAEMTGEL
ncbi:hypothetical protein ACHWQZ_G007832 [Mnemiopsis leidyi]